MIVEHVNFATGRIPERVFGWPVYDALGARPRARSACGYNPDLDRPPVGDAPCGRWESNAAQVDSGDEIY
jgi:hypothetical protein